MGNLKWQSKCKKYTVEIELVCIDKIKSVAKNKYPKEIGSSLIGKYTDNGYTAIIKDIAPIPKDSIFGNAFFKRGSFGLKEYYKNLFKKYNGEIYYIGEWHSHPNGSHSPSSKDSTTQFGIAKNGQINCPECILLIIGGDLISNPSIGIFVYNDKKEKIELVEVNQNSNPFSQ